MKNRKLFWILILLFFPSVVYANVGTPLMWAEAFHLLIGNAVIGVIEGLLISYIFHKSKKKTLLFMILLNYFSMLIGLMIVFAVESMKLLIFDINIQNALFYMCLFLFLFYLITLIVEFPFIFALFWKDENRMRKSISAAVVVNIVSYLFLFALYWMTSSASMINDLDLISADKMGLPPDYSLYYIPTDKKNVFKSDLNGKNSEIIKEVNIDGNDSALVVVENKEKSQFDLYLDSEGDFVLIESNFSVLSLENQISGKGYNSNIEVNNVYKKSKWKYFNGIWATGIYGRNDEESKHFRFSMNTPFISWETRNATHIEGDFVIFQLSEDQICILQPEKKQIALIARGFGPVVAKK